MDIYLWKYILLRNQFNFAVLCPKYITNENPLNSVQESIARILINTQIHSQYLNDLKQLMYKQFQQYFGLA